MARRGRYLQQRRRSAFALRVLGLSLLLLAFLRAASVIGKAGGSASIVDAAMPLLCVAAAAIVLVVDRLLSRRRREGAGRDRSRAVRQLHRELDAALGRPPDARRTSKPVGGGTIEGA